MCQHLIYFIVSILSCHSIHDTIKRLSPDLMLRIYPKLRKINNEKMFKTNGNGMYGSPLVT